jgi:signal transduction histidine kinase
MTGSGTRRTVSCVGIPYALRTIGIVALVAIVASILAVDPKPALSGDGLWVTLSLAALVAGAFVAMPWRGISDARRLAGLLLIAISTVVLTGVQPDGGGSAGVYIVVVIAAMRLPLVPALAISGLVLGGEVLVTALVVPDPGAKISGLLFSVIPWFLFIRLMRQLRAGRDEAEALVEELRASRAETAQAAALAERSRLAREMHDVLAHSLSALALQLEGARLLARDRDTDPEVVAAIERAHHLAGSGLSEARSAISTLRGDDLPGLDTLADRFGDRVDVSVEGEPRELASEAQLALYRTAQEALTNVVRHSAAEHVSLAVAYEPGGTRLVVEDSGPAVNGSASVGGGYGLTGMRERAELLGGRLNAGPAGDGFRVELWLPA